MKVKMVDVVGSADALGALSQKSLPAATAFKVAKVNAAVKQPLQDFDSVRLKLLGEVGERINDTDQYKIKDAERWVNEMTALGNQEVEIPDDQISIDDLGKCDIEPRILTQLHWLFKL